MFNIITFGSASQDIYVKSRKFLILSGRNFNTGKGICLALGSKNKVEDVFLSFGGGGTNTAATFVNQGLKTAWCGQVGNDYFGDLAVAELKKLKISAEFTKKAKNLATNISVFLTFPGKDRTILIHRGASDDLKKDDIPWQKIKKTKWFYLAPFSGKLASLTEDLVNFGCKFNIKIAWNPGYNQLRFSKLVLARILKKIDILILNRQEACLLAKISSYKDEKEIFRKIGKMTKGIIVMTKGPRGAVVFDGKYTYSSPAMPAKLVDSTGAGDAFGSGFVAGMIKKNDIIFAVQLASANSASCITEWGAKKGLLGKSQKWRKIKVKKELSSKINYAE